MLDDRSLARLLGLGALAVLLGAFLPWADGADGKEFGVDLSAGRVTLALALAGGAAALLARRGAVRAAGMAALAAGVGVALLGLARLESSAGAGPGVVVTIGGAVALVHGGIQALRRRA